METLRPRSRGKATNRRPLIRGLRLLFGLTLVVSGLTLAGSSFYSIFVQEDVLAGEQQDSASQYKNVEDATSYTKTFKDADGNLKTGDVFAKVYFPRFGQDWVRLIGEGIKWEPVLNEIGVGHYPKSQFPGEVGNSPAPNH